MAQARSTRKRSAPATGPRAGAKAKKSAEAEKPGIVVDGVKYALDDLTLRELTELEDYVGAPMDEIHYGSAKTIAFVVYLVRRRGDASYELDTALDITVGRIGGEGGAAVAVEAGPTEPASE